uniref:Protein CNPPD1 n=1 Tax=Strigamia maritima TaxID=126957 RepID=T1J2H0_STRMM
MQNEAEQFATRFRKTLRTRLDRSSLHLTSLAVEYFAQNVPPKLGEVDLHFAASLSRRARLSPCTLMLAFVYVDRLRTYNPQYLHSISSSHLFLASVIIASKFMNDEGEDDEILNYEWALSASMETQDVNQLEREFLAALDWRVFVDTRTFKQIVDQTEFFLALVEGRKNGWFSYTDLDVLTRQLRNLDIFRLIMDQIFKVTLVCAVTYTAGILTMVASTYTVACVMASISYSTPNNTLLTIQGKNCAVEFAFPAADLSEAEFNFTESGKYVLLTNEQVRSDKCCNSSLYFANNCGYKFVETFWTLHSGTLQVVR